jgi:ribosomal protein S18 acetylase RimI-like enzyme
MMGHDQDMNGLIFRCYIEGDELALFNHLSESSMRVWQRRPRFLFLEDPRFHSQGFRIAQHAEKIVGSVSSLIKQFRLPDNTHTLGEIMSVAVSPGFRRRGIAARLVRATLAYLESNDCEAAYLRVEKSNHVAYRMYNKLGFREFIPDRWAMVKLLRLRTAPRLVPGLLRFAPRRMLRLSLGQIQDLPHIMLKRIRPTRVSMSEARTRELDVVSKIFSSEESESDFCEVLETGHLRKRLERSVGRGNKIALFRDDAGNDIGALVSAVEEAHLFGSPVKVCFINPLAFLGSASSALAAESLSLFLQSMKEEVDLCAISCYPETALMKAVQDLGFFVGVNDTVIMMEPLGRQVSPLMTSFKPRKPLMHTTW